MHSALNALLSLRSSLSSVCVVESMAIRVCTSSHVINMVVVIITYILATYSSLLSSFSLFFKVLLLYTAPIILTY